MFPDLSEKSKLNTYNSFLISMILVLSRLKLLFKKSDVVYITAIFLLLIIFQGAIENAVYVFLIKPIFSLVKFIWWNDIIFFLFTLFIIAFTIQKVKYDFIPSGRIILIIFGLCLFYLTFRLTEDLWEFTPFYFFSFLRYADILIAVGLSAFVIVINSLLKKEENVIREPRFYIDEPLKTQEEIDEDLYDYENYTSEIALRIKNSNFKQAFAIGINGPWGFGKTSFINLLKKSFEPNEFIDVTFNPWNSNTPNAIIQDFFESFQEAIRPYSSSLEKDISVYSKKILEINDSTISQSLLTTLNFFIRFESVEAMRERIKAETYRINKKIIVTIDDLDRLAKEEIIEVIRLIRNTANFGNVFFLVAYDREYITNAIKDINSHNEQHYLEKIFQLEVSLPAFNKDVLRRQLISKLKSTLSSSKHELIETICEKKLGNQIFERWICNLRDVTRLVNGISLNFAKLLNSGDVEFLDCVVLEILRLKYPQVYKQFFDFPNDFLVNQKDRVDSYYVLRQSTESKEVFVLQEKFESSLGAENAKLIVELLRLVFSNGDDLNYDLYYTPKLSVVYASKFYRYSSYSLFGEKISETDFGNALDSPEVDFFKEIDNWTSQGLEEELKFKFSSIRGCDNKEQFEKVVKGIFYLARKVSINKKNSSKGIVGYSTDNLYDILSNSYDKTSDTFYNQTLSDYQTFVNRLFSEAPAPYLFESAFLYSLNMWRTNHVFPISLNERMNTIIEYISKYANKYKQFDSNLKELFLDSKSPQTNTFPDEAISIILDLARTSDLEGFLSFIIRTNPREEKSYYIDYNQFFKSREAFEGFIFALEDEKWRSLSEFKLFYKKLQNNDGNSVPFNFDLLSVSDDEKKRPKEFLFQRRR